MSQNSSRRQKAAKWAGKASLFVANQYLKPKQQQGKTSPETEEKLAQTASETPQEIKEKPDQKSRRRKVGKWGKQASLFAAKEYLRRNDQQVSEQKKPTLLETFLEIIKVSVYAICAIALSILLLTLRFGYGVR
ncbi:hypothetical protein FRE64_07155 [Euhalothece natronophila Z-M001]|uniref:Uncharacterized protein n=1 Tax=Euhalothece natronophila Z-M001 TaxID=522448 RepID=A0A5B8NNB2_9CHRO|nr:hypothetical protein [Euhalothece natronophila]QDZ39735.1 hypothetical protein FRE64_07155 [Euhalothece natronophila Z-M001]